MMPATNKICVRNSSVGMMEKVILMHIEGPTTLIEGVMESETMSVEARDFGGMIQASKLLGAMVEVSICNTLKIVSFEIERN
jgi:hypothetical protein